MASRESPIQDLGTASRLEVFLHILTLILLLACAALLRFHALGRKSVWIDEGVSIEMARLDGYNFLRILWRHEANMALYTTLLRFWILLGRSEAYLRALSVGFALATLVALYFLGRRMFNARIGLLAVFLLTINAYHVRYSQEARSYSLYPFLVVVSSIYFLKFLDEPSPRNRRGHVLASALGVYAHFFAGFVVLTQWLSLRLLDRKQREVETGKNWRWFWIAVAPIALFILTTGSGVIRWIPRPTFSQLGTTALFLSGNGGIWLALTYLAASLRALLPLAGWRQRRVSWESWRYRYLLVWLLVPIALVFLVSQLKPMFLARYFVFTLPALALLAASGLGQLRSRWLLGGALILLSVLSLGGVSAYYQKDFDIAREDWRTTTRYLLAHVERGDVVIFHQPIGRMPYEYYRSLIPAPAYPTVLYPAHAEQLTFRDFYAGHAPDEFLESVPERYRRVWVLFTYNQLPSGPDPTTSLIDRVFGREYSSLKCEHFAGIELRLYSQGKAGGQD